MLKPASSACNLRCSYCFYAEEAASRCHADRGIMTEPTMRAIITKALAYAGASADARVSFSFQGGEPLLAGLAFYKEFVRITKACNTAGIPVEFALQTNGTRLDDAFAAFFAQEHFLIGLSLDGIPAIHDQFRTDPAGNGTYAEVCRAAHLLQKHAVPYNILCVVTDALCAHGDAVWTALQEHRFLQFIPCQLSLTVQHPLTVQHSPTVHTVSHTPSPQQYAQFLDAVFRGYYRAFRRGTPVSVRTFDNWLNLLLRLPPESCAMCGICMPNLVIEADGDAYPCDFYAQDAFCLGNLTDADTDIETLLTQQTMQSFLQASHTVPDLCRRCRYYPLCRNGCRRERTLPDGRTHHCAAYRQFFDRHIGQLEEMADLIESHLKQQRRTP